MGKVCRHCCELAVEYEEEENLDVCANCGAINEHFSRLEHHNTSDGAAGETTVGRGNWRSRRHYVTETRREANAKAYLEEQVLKLNIPPVIVEQIKAFLIDEVLELDIMFPRSRAVTVASCVFIVARQNDMLYTMRSVAQATQTDVFLVGRTVKAICKRLMIEIPPIEPHAYVPMVLKQFEVESEKLPECHKLAIDVLNLCDKLILHVNHPPLQRATAVVALCVECKIKRPTLKKLQKICCTNGVYLNSLEESLRDLNDEFKGIALKIIPWATASVLRIAKWLPDIIEFQDLIEDFPSAWQHKREHDLAARKHKIKQAKERIQNGKTESQSSEDLPAVKSKKRKIRRLPAVTGRKKSLSKGFDEEDKIIEDLLRKGVSEELLEGDLKPLSADLQDLGDNVDLDRPELDEKDIPNEELQNYMIDSAEVEYKHMVTSFSLKRRASISRPRDKKQGLIVKKRRK